MLTNTVTAIKAATKNENRVNIFINEKFDFSLDIAQVIDLKIKVGKSLSASELSKCRKASEFGKLYQHTLEYVLSRPHSIKETRDHLKKRLKNRELSNRYAIKNRERSREEREKFKLRTRELALYTNADIDAVIDKLQAKKYLNDESFAKYYLENRFDRKGISARRLKEELAKKGISEATIEKVFSDNPRDEQEEIKKIIKRKRGKYTEEKLIAYLVRQGFDYQLAKAAVHETDSQN